MSSRPWEPVVVGAAAGVAAGLLTFAACSYLRPHSKGSHSHPSKPDAQSSPAVSAGPVAVKDFLDDDVLSEQFTRNVQFFGAEGQQQIAKAFVIVIGLGGVGSHAAHMLLRSGVGKLRLVDFDQVTVSSLNRHATATRADVGLPKARCLATHFTHMVPEAEVEAVVEMYTADREDALLRGNPDYVIDAIDNIETKVALLEACKRRGLQCISVAAAGSKADPTRLRITDISESSIDPLARAVRHRLRRQHGINSGITMVLSTEKPRVGLVSHVGPSENLLDYQVVPGFRVRTVPVLGTTPAIFGMAAAGYVLCQLAGQPFEGEPIIQLQAQQYSRQLARLEQREEERFGTSEGVAVDLDDMVYLVREVWRGFSAKGPRVALPGSDKGLMRSTADLVLTRWDASKPATVDNLVLLTFEEAAAHDDAGSLESVQQLDAQFAQFVEGVLQRVRAEYCGWSSCSQCAH